MKKEIILAAVLLTGCAKANVPVPEPVLPFSRTALIADRPTLADLPEPIVEEPEVEDIDEVFGDSEINFNDLFTITYYCGCELCNGGYGAIDALGNPLVEGTIACNVLPLGTHVWIDGKEYVVRDRLAARYNGVNRIDVYVPDHQQALDLGIRYNVEVFVDYN